MPTILVVEDEPVRLILVASWLERCGHAVFEPATVPEALEVLRVQTVDLILSDMELAGHHDGTALARWTTEHRPEVQVLVTSGRNVPELAGLGLADHFIPKPYLPTLVEQRIREVLCAAAPQ